LEEERRTKNARQNSSYKCSNSEPQAPLLFSFEEEEPELGNPINGAMNQRSVTVSNGLTGHGSNRAEEFTACSIPAWQARTTVGGKHLPAITASSLRSRKGSGRPPLATPQR
jgi:hypothetical protein